MKKLILIPARGGSKGIPKKNLKLFNNVPLIKYTVDFAIKTFPNDEICLSTDSLEIIDYCKSLGLDSQFIRPQEFSTDTSSSRDVILHALEFFEKKEEFFEHIILLQPTTPIRNSALKDESFKILNEFPNIDMIVSVKESKANPYFNLFEENNSGFLNKSKKSSAIRRQDCPTVYEFTGSYYLIKVSSIKEKPIYLFENIKKIVVSNPTENIDLDTFLDWEYGEILLKKFNQ
ncbi:acylneuraminate cytidylyltransferase family protein [Sphingobacterium daejeonense]|uniref:acylneuraminate cytidylyltransferase family protein n=1 Tax=Sphingobacterium daejeonense TaxID=371142 RepID=UPI0021A54A29|nr:acylneuraminate cytidylyltransferase family protein [Sphingobacterium daejeonense]MCT1532642.1 acylneuraminate cytidylyltransferase family protein [Sphingobacterium daejeonense]